MKNFPIARRPDDASQPEYGSWGPFLGFASFYSTEYNGFYIGMNTTSDREFTLSLPKGKYVDVATDKTTNITDGSYSVNPLSTVVLKRL